MKTALALAIALYAQPVFADDRVEGYLALFENWCLPRLENPTMDWRSAYPAKGDTIVKTFSFSAVKIEIEKHIYSPFGLSLTQDEFKCTVSDEEPYFTDTQKAGVEAGLSKLVGHRFPDLLMHNDTDLQWTLNRGWTDAPAGTAAVTWGIFLLRISDDLPWFSTFIALPRK